MSHFMRLPPELRVMIWRHCLVIGKIFPYLEKQEEVGAKTDVNTIGKKPSLSTTEERRENPFLCLGLLEMDRFLRDEITQFLCEHNTVVVPLAPSAAKFFDKCLNSPEKRLWLRNIELELSAADMSLDEKNNLRRSSSQQEHDTWKAHLIRVIWPRKLAPILSSTKLDKLTIKFSDSKCPTRCPRPACYLEVQACAAFRAGFAKGMVAHISLHDLTFRDVGDFEHPDAEAFKRGDREIDGVEMPIVSDESEGRVERDAVQAGEQIARWTRARELGRGDGTRLWFRALEEAVEEAEGDEDDEEDGEDGEDEEDEGYEEDEEEDEGYEGDDEREDDEHQHDEREDDEH